MKKATRFVRKLFLRTARKVCSKQIYGQDGRVDDGDDKPGGIYTHVTVATDPGNVQVIWKSIQADVFVGSFGPWGV